MNIWIVADTACYPRRWKVTRQHGQGPGSSENAWTNYFENRADAYTEAERRNAADRQANKNFEADR